MGPTVRLPRRDSLIPDRSLRQRRFGGPRPVAVLACWILISGLVPAGAAVARGPVAVPSSPAVQGHGTKGAGAAGEGSGEPVRSLEPAISVRPTPVSAGSETAHPPKLPFRSGPAKATRTSVRTGSASSPDTSAVLPSGPSPAVSSSFLGALRDGTNDSIPPDTQGAVGPNHVMSVVNYTATVRSRTGTLLATYLLDDFWTYTEAPSTNYVFDPRIQYDSASSRWILVALALCCTTDPTSTDLSKSALLIAVSDTSDPTGTWTPYAYGVRRVGEATSIWADYPTVGFNGSWIVISTNMFDANFLTGRVWAFDKAKLYAHCATACGVVLPDAPVGWSAQPLTQLFSLAPAVTYGSTSAVYLASSYCSTCWTTADPGTSRYVTLFKISGALGNPEYRYLGYVQAPDAMSTWDTVPGASGDAPQAGSADKIDNGDARMQKCVFRNGSLWCAHTVFLPGGGPITQSAVQWWEIVPTTTGGVVEQVSRINAGATTFRAYPSIDVNKYSDVLVGYSRFSSAQYASANYAFRYASDAANTFADDTVLKAGEAPYVASAATTDDFGRLRWGDFSSVAIDPVDDTSLWTIQEYSAPPFGGGASRWGIWWGRVAAGAPAIPANNNFANAQAISGTGTLTPSNAGATAQASEPAHAGSAAWASLWYTWTAPASGAASIDTHGSNADTKLAVYTGSTLTGLTEVASNDDVSGTDLDSAVSFAATSGQTYRIAVDGFNGSRGALALNWILPASGGPTANFTATPLLGVAPLLVTFTDQSTGGATGWAWDFDANGTTDSTAQNPTHTYNVAGNYSVRLTATNVDGSGSKLRTSYISVGTSNPPPANDNVANAATIAINGTASVDTTEATTENPERIPTGCPAAVGSGVLGKTVWYTFHPTANAAMTVDTIGSDFDTVLTVYRQGPSGLVEVTCNDDIAGDNGNSRVSFVATGGQDLFYQVGGWGGDSGSLVVHSTGTYDSTAPTLGTPTYKLLSGATLGTSGARIPVRISWTASDSGVGISNFVIYRSVNGAAYVPLTTLSALARTYNVMLSSSSTTSYRYYVRAVDKAGNAVGRASSPFHVYVVEDLSSRFAYSPKTSWFPSTSSSYSGGRVAFAKRASSLAKLTFTGRQIAFVSTKAASRGSATFKLGSTTVGSASMYSSTTHYRSLAWVSSMYSSASRVLSIIVRGTSGHPRVDVDAVIILW